MYPQPTLPVLEDSIDFDVQIRCVQTGDNFHKVYTRQWLFGFSWWCWDRDFPYNHFDAIRAMRRFSNVVFVDRRK
jgi:hypothetical protein